MRSEQRLRARRNLDKKLRLLSGHSSLIRPSSGWIRAIRTALGMTSTQFGARIGVSQPRTLAIEKGEVNGTLSLNALDRAAQALDCQLVYALVPNDSLQGAVEARAKAIAAKRLRYAAHHMSLENQSVNDSAQRLAFKKLTNQLAEKSGSELWEDTHER